MSVFWVQINLGKKDLGAVPVQDSGNGFEFCDGAYGVFDHYYRDSDDSTEYQAFETALLALCPFLDKGKEDVQYTLNANGDVFTVCKQFLNNYGTRD